MLPGWYGFGTAVERWLASNCDGLARLARMYERWPFFRATMSNMGMVLAKTDLAIASRYAELVDDARVRALLRRGSLSGSQDLLRYADLRLDPAARLAWRGDRPLKLTKTEFDLLELLAFNAGIVLSRETLYERIWGYDFETSSRSLDVYIGYLRAKLEADGEPRLVQTVRGVGFVVREQ